MTITTAWPTEPATGRGRSHGTSSAAAFDRWFRYPAGFASDYVARLVDKLGLEEGVLVDCFMGSGVTGTAALDAGLSFSGIEAHPLVAELATLKLGLDVDAGKLREAAAKMVPPGAPTTARADETSLVQQSFPDEVLDQLLALREGIQARTASPETVALKWALLATLRDVADVKVGWPYQRPGVSRVPRHRDASARFLRRVEMIAEDVEGRRASDATVNVIVGSSADASSWATLPPSDGCITSPPYLNNFDYADATRLELYFWGEVRTWREMCDTVRQDMIVATTQQSSKGLKIAAIETLEARGDALGEDLIALAGRIEAASRARGPRGKEYDRVLPSYFVTMGEILGNLEGNLAPGATAVWLVGDSAPYGVYVDTPGLIGRVAESVGLDCVETIEMRKRGQRWNRGGHPLSEQMVVLRKPS